MKKFLTSTFHRAFNNKQILTIMKYILQVLVSIATYTLFLLDARRQTFWEKLDDYVYYIRAFGNSVEFCFGIFLFFNGAWILVFESGKKIIILLLYFNEAHDDVASIHILLTNNYTFTLFIHFLSIDCIVKRGKKCILHDIIF